MPTHDFERLDVLTGEVGKGDLFIGPGGQQVNLSSVNVLWSGVDTVRQLFQGRLKPELLAEIAHSYDSGHDATFTVNNTLFRVMSGRRGGFRYILQNREFGLTILIQNFYAEADSQGTHVKIETSPRWLYERTSDQIHHELMFWGRQFLTGMEPSGVAIHLAVDFQGWEPPTHFAQSFVTRAKTVSVHNGVSSIEWETGSTVNGRGETYTFGKANSLQTCLYNKSKEIDVSDKRAFMEGIWDCAVSEESFPDTCYDRDKPVWRLEIRLHHRIVNEIWQGSDIKPIVDFAGAVPHLTGLWRYALQRNRFEVKRDWNHPVWTKLRDDVSFGWDAPSLAYKRAKKQPGCGNEKNVSLAFGNLMSIYARNHFNPRQAWDCLKTSGLWEDLTSYYRNRGIGKNELFKLIEDGLIRRRLLTKVAS
ncbi:MULTISPECIES: hypothetical protein [unclassified Marinobacter]|uniref:hypothetical protein n=1 Tax=unclassified Marinobacter TaxID=83889 RepID=UPI00200E5D02|nr:MULTISPECIES: hypothetical protein [unclassified Marinobacter]UQG55512.1 hypothetical protein MIH16_19315 [Marinobacter sp. M4C]UQG64316.1 hypothetical protein MIH17_19310 [Marinobacter sp. M2C]UQG68595.1 hypothetical protein MIH19_19320 [Marinobacter sp. M1C]